MIYKYTGYRYVVEECDWDKDGHPVAWAIWDKATRLQYGDVTWQRRSTAETVARLLNRRGE